MLRRLAAPLALLVATLAAGASATASERSLVVEFFTSQGCSACPPADRLVAELASRPDMLVLTLPVDLWDYLGWRDTLARPEFTRRQKGYAHARGDRQVYTPQVVVNGHSHAVGSDREAVEKALHIASREAPATLGITLVQAGGDLVISLPAAPGADAEVALLPIVLERSVQIGRGENTGRHATYTHVVLGIVPLGRWDGAPTERRLNIAGLPAEAEAAVVIVQRGTLKRPAGVLGASRIALRRSGP